MLLSKQKKSPGNSKSSGNRLLISVTVVGSPGPLRFVVNEEELVAAVIDTALKSYAREGRFPVLGSDFNDFVLYCPSYAIEALSPWETIGSIGVRNFMLCKKPETLKKAAAAGGGGDKSPDKSQVVAARKPSGSWKSWLNKALNLKISSH